MSTTLEVSTTAGKSGSTPAASAPVAMTDPAAYKPRAARYEIKDAVVPGLRLVVQPNGKKSWALRFSQAGEYRKITFGPFPLIPLAESAEARKARLARDPASIPPDARGLARHFLGLKATGVDIAELWDQQNRADTAVKDEAQTVTVKAQFQNFLDRPNRRTGKSKRVSSRERYEGIMKPLMANWGDRDVRKITKAECEDALIEAGKRGEHAKASLFMLLNGFFVWLEKRDTIQKSPMKSFDRIAAESNNERALTDEELKLIWGACDQIGTYGRIIRLLMLTGQRLNAVAAMKWSQINLEKKIWEIPNELGMKADRSHIVCLSDAALKVIESMPRIQGCDYVFKDKGPTHFKGYSNGKRRLDKLAKTATPWKPQQDVRRTFITRAASDLKIPQKIIHKIVNHGVERGSLAALDRVYNKYDYETERRAAMDAWADRLKFIVTGSPASNVVPLRAPAEAVPA